MASLVMENVKTEELTAIGAGVWITRFLTLDLGTVRQSTGSPSGGEAPWEVSGLLGLVHHRVGLRPSGPNQSSQFDTVISALPPFRLKTKSRLENSDEAGNIRK